MNLEEIMPGKTDRAAFVGQTGSGKTTLARFVLMMRPYVVVFDPKGQMDVVKDWPSYKLHTRLAELVQAKEPRLIYRPVYAELNDDEIMDEFFEWVYLRKNTTLYVDEIYAVAHGDVYPWYLGACLTRGRERGIQVFIASQRPSRVPQVMFSEAEHVYCFNLKMPQDRERMADITGLTDDDLALPKHQFYYAPQEGVVRGPMKLKLGKAA